MCGQRLYRPLCGHIRAQSEAKTPRTCEKDPGHLRPGPANSAAFRGQSYRARRGTTYAARPASSCYCRPIVCLYKPRLKKARYRPGRILSGRRWSFCKWPVVPFPGASSSVSSFTAPLRRPYPSPCRFSPASTNRTGNSRRPGQYVRAPSLPCPIGKSSSEHSAAHRS